MQFGCKRIAKMEDEIEVKKKKQGNNVPTWGNTSTMNINNMVHTNILSSPYFKKNLFALKTYHEVVDEIYYKVTHLEPWEKGSRKTSGQVGMCGGVRGVGAGGIVSSCYCLLFKLFTLKLTRKQLKGLIDHCDSPYIRGIGFMYIRYCIQPKEIWSWVEPYLEDEEEVDVKAGGGCTMTIGQLVRSFLLRLEWYGTLFPRIPVPVEKEIRERLTQLNLCDDHKRKADDCWGEAERYSKAKREDDDGARPKSANDFGEAERYARLQRRSRSRERSADKFGKDDDHWRGRRSRSVDRSRAKTDRASRERSRERNRGRSRDGSKERAVRRSLDRHKEHRSRRSRSGDRPRVRTDRRSRSGDRPRVRSDRRSHSGDRPRVRSDRRSKSRDRSKERSFKDRPHRSWSRDRSERDRHNKSHRSHSKERGANGRTDRLRRSHSKERQERHHRSGIREPSSRQKDVDDGHRKKHTEKERRSRSRERAKERRRRSHSRDHSKERKHLEKRIRRSGEVSPGKETHDDEEKKDGGVMDGTSDKRKKSPEKDSFYRVNDKDKDFKKHEDRIDDNENSDISRHNSEENVGVKPGEISDELEAGELPDDEHRLPKHKKKKKKKDREDKKSRGKDKEEEIFIKKHKSKKAKRKHGDLERSRDST